MTYFLGLWFILAICLPTLRSLWPQAYPPGIPSQWPMNLSYGAIGYGVWGYFLKDHPLKKRGLVLGLSLLMVGGLTLYLSYRAGTYQGALMEGMSLFVCLYAGALFSGEIGGTSHPLTCLLSKASFSIYLSHMVFVKVLLDREFYRLVPAILGIPLALVLVILAGLLLYGLLVRIPFLRTYSS
ncbi:MAG: hypothetical protein Q4E37_07100 [Tissierellia bacterium]|nr:hypothetical protein [Tissierellia bacterium]